MASAPPFLDVVSFGEMLGAFTPATAGPLSGIRSFDKQVSGAEANVCVGLSRLGHRIGWCGRLGDDPIGHECLTTLRGEGVDTSRVAIDDQAPTGLYLKEFGALGLRVYYYRTGSAASRSRYDDLDIDYLLSGRMLHLSGVTAQLSDECAVLVQRVMEAAVDRGVAISFDVNIRWGLVESRNPRDLLLPLARLADTLFLSSEEAETLFGSADPDVITTADPSFRASTVVVHDAAGAFAIHDAGLDRVPARTIQVRDVVGAGDAFAAGYLSGQLRGWPPAQSLRLAELCAACVVAVPGDQNGLPTERDALADLNMTPTHER